MTSYKYAHVM